jgi:hypothetical protein
MRDTDVGPSPSTPLRLTHIEADLASLEQFRSFVSRELHTNLRPAAQDIGRDHSRGVGFGYRNAGNHVQSARQRYHESLTASTTNLAAYIDASEMLIDAIGRIVAGYRDTDALSAANSGAVNAQFGAAVAAAQTAQANAASAARVRSEAQKFSAIDWETGW